MPRSSECVSCQTKRGFTSNTHAWSLGIYHLKSHLDKLAHLGGVLWVLWVSLWVCYIAIVSQPTLSCIKRTTCNSLAKQDALF